MQELRINLISSCRNGFDGNSYFTVKLFRYVTIIDTTCSKKIKKMYDEKSLIDVVALEKELGQSITLYENEECTAEYDLSKPITDNITLYIDTKKSVTVWITATASDKIFATQSRLPENSTVILACYKDGKCVDMKYAKSGSETIYFTTNADFDYAKVMAWNSLKDMAPVCRAEIIK